MSRFNEVRWIDLPSVRDQRGILTAVEGGIDIPFEIKRIFYMHHIVADRGGHAHMDTDQVVTALHGRFKMDLTDGYERLSFVMDDPTRGVYVPRMIFIELHDHSPDAVGLVLASDHYDIKRSLRSWRAYQEALGL